MKILSCGAGMQSTALALMSCENKTKGMLHPLVPIYDAIIFCDLGEEPYWVYDQVNFIKCACEDATIPFYILEKNLYSHYIENYGNSRVVSVPWWTEDEEGHKSRMPRNCTLEFKVDVITKFVRWELLGYKKGQRLKDEDLKAHEMHMGFSWEERKRCKDNPHKMFINKFPLVDMQLERKDNYAYIKDVWGLETKASACSFCPFHRNYFFKYIKENAEDDYEKVLVLDDIFENTDNFRGIKSKLYISRSRKRIKDLTEEDCNDKETFDYKGEEIWNGF